MPQDRGEHADAEVARQAAVKDLLAEAYGVTVDGLTFLGGELDRNYRVTTAAGEHLLAKWQASQDGADSRRWREEILAHLVGRDVGAAVPTIIPTLDGARHTRIGAEGVVLTVFNWVPGTELAKIEYHSEALLTHLGMTAARVTTALEGFPVEMLPTTHHWDATRSREAILACITDEPQLATEHFVRTTLDYFDAIAPRLDALPRAVLHHDLNDNNVLVDTSQHTVSGVLDFNDALYTIQVAEVAIAGAYAMLRKDDPLSALARVVSGYRSVRALNDDELEIIYPLAVSRLCVQTLTWTVRDRASPTSYGSMRMQHTLPTLRKALRVTPAAAAEYLYTAGQPTTLASGEGLRQ